METFQLEFSDKTVRTIFQNGEGRMMQLSLGAGEGLEQHMAKFALALVVLSGRVTFSTAAESVELGPLQMTSVPALQEHAVKAVEESVLLLTLMPGTPFAASQDDSDLETAYTNPALRKKIAPELIPFVDDHAHVYEALQNIRRDFSKTLVKSTLDLIGDELDRHFVYEEEILFPRLTVILGGPDVGPVPKLLAEHKRIRKQYETCSALLEAWTSDGSRESTMRMQIQQLSQNLQQHIAKEDNHLFSMASRLLSATDKEEIAHELLQRDGGMKVVVD